MTYSEWLYNLLRAEGRQRKEEGCHPSEVDRIIAQVSGQSSEEEINQIYDRLMDLPLQPDFPFIEPTDFEKIKKGSPGFASAQNTHAKDILDLEDRMAGAWLGRCSGCALGKPIERGPYMNGKEGVPGWQGVRIYLKAADAWPLTDWVPDIGEVEGYDVGCPDSTKGRIRFMETDDDIRYTVLGLKILEDKGGSFTTSDVANAWLNILPLGQTFTAERQAYRNLARVIELGDLESKIDWVRMHRNPFREWIGAQIRADGWAYGAAGRPALGAEFGYRDAALSHVKNGIYGEMLFAAAIAAGFTADSPLDALREGLRYIPAQSRLVKDVEEAIEMGLEIGELDTLHDMLWQKWGHYDGVHTNNNAALVAAAIAWGGEDFEKVIVCAVTGGWDTDCNGATAGSLWGAVYGKSGLPAKWTDPLNDTLYAAIPGFHPITISECARRSVEVAKGIA